jgi:hypothetical protein
VQIDGKWGDLGKAEAKAFAAAVSGMTAEECEAHDMESILEACAGPGQPFAGKVVATEASSHTTKSGFEMTKHVWIVADGTPAAPVPAAPAAPAAPPPAPPEAPPPALPDGYFAFPAGDPRCGIEAYNAEGETIKI